VIGDGENVILDAINDKPNKSIFTGAEKSVLYSQANIKENSYCYNNESTEISRIEIARGCKYKCPYCQLTFLKKYREVSTGAVKEAIENSQYKRVALFAPNGMSHSHYDDIVDYAAGKELVNIASDVRYNEIDRFRNNATARMGIEGLSAKLRKQVTKPLSKEKFRNLIIKRMDQCRSNGYNPSLHTYFILDLPNETEDDWQEFEEFLWECNSIKGVEDFTWIITGNVFMPSPFTPYENEPIHIDIDYSKKLKTVFTDRDKPEQFKFTLTGRHSVFSPYSRLLSMIATRCGPDDSELIYNIATNKTLKKESVGGWKRQLDILTSFIDRNYGGIDRFTGVPPIKHWNVVEVDHAKQSRPGQKTKTDSPKTA